MAGPWSDPIGADARRAAARAHDAVVGERASGQGIRPIIEESWRRSLSLDLDPDRPLSEVDLAWDDLREYRDSHPLALALPTIHRLLIRHTFEAGLIVAVGDQDGRLLWIDGDRDLRRKAEGMLFVEGADWSEARVGTSAPGTALALDQSLQIQGPEHFNRIVHPWSCTAVPVHDPSGGMLGVIDITGGDEAVAPATLPLLEAAAAAVEAELRIQRLDDPPRRRVIQRATPRPDDSATLAILGTEGGRLESRGRSAELSGRHAEILALLAWHPSGLSAERLADLLGTTVATLRPEMVRLRKAVEQVDESLVPLARPYRVPRRLDLDAQRVLAFLDRGAHRVALGGYPGQVLPVSSAPGIREIREEVSARLRESLMADASVDTLLEYARTDEAAYDAEVWSAVLKLLPPKSPKRASVVARLERIEAELG